VCIDNGQFAGVAKEAIKLTMVIMFAASLAYFKSIPESEGDVAAILLTRDSVDWLCLSSRRGGRHSYPPREKQG